MQYQLGEIPLLPKSRHQSSAFCLVCLLVWSFHFDIQLVVIICGRIPYLASQKKTIDENVPFLIFFSDADRW